MLFTRPLAACTAWRVFGIRAGLEAMPFFGAMPTHFDLASAILGEVAELLALETFCGNAMLNNFAGRPTEEEPSFG